MKRGGRAAIGLVLFALVLGAAAAAGSPRPSPPVSARPDSARLAPARPGLVTISDATEAGRALAVSRALFTTAQGIVLVPAGSTSSGAQAAAAAARLHVPALVAPTEAAGRAATRREVRRLGARWYAPIGPARLAGLARHGLTGATPAPPAAHRTVLLAAEDGAGAAAATARAAGASVIALPASGTDPTASPAAVTALHAGRAGQVLLVGSAFAREPDLDWKVRAAETGWQLPGGGQRAIGSHRFVALYGAPGAPVLGVLGHQGPAATVRRVQALAARYRPLSDRPVVPTLEIIATVASGSPGSDGTYSTRLPPSVLLPYITAAERAHVSVILDLQPGRADFLSQAKAYAPLLERPDVGLALDPEWRLGPTQVPLEQIGSVGAAEVNRTSLWLARLVRDRGLPPKLLVLHQFRFSMLPDRQRVVSRPELDLAVHVDGQGTQPDKQATWRALHEDPLPHSGWGWKNFLVKDLPVLTPEQTMRDVHPTPDLITYQ